MAQENLSPYLPGSLLKLRTNHLGNSNRPTTLVTAEILKCFSCTLTVVTLVRIRKDLYVLKMYDRRFAKDVRKDADCAEWTEKLEMQYRKYTYTKEHDERIFKLRNDFQAYVLEAGEDWNNVQNEAFCQHYCDQQYDTESAVYDRLKPLQGKDIPRLVAKVELMEPHHRQLGSTKLTASLLGSIPHVHRGLLVQYIKGFSLFDMYDLDTCPTPRHAWQHIGDDAIRIVNVIRSYDILNEDCQNRNSVVSWDPIKKQYKVFLIDFGCCQIKSATQSDGEFYSMMQSTDEEGAIGLVLMRKLERKYGGEGFVWKRSEF